MFSRFLREASEIAGEQRWKESADEFQYIGDKWEDLREWFRQTSDDDNPIPLLGDCAALLNELARLEEVAWSRLREIGRTHK